MAGTRQPTAVVVAKGKKHLSAAEKAERLRHEVPIVPKKEQKKGVVIRYPERLPERMKPRFREYALQLIALGIYMNEKGSGDADALRDYMLHQQSYLNEIGFKNKALSQISGSLTDEQREEAMAQVSYWSKLIARDYNLAKAAANSIGLTVSARCKLVIPQPDEPEDESIMGGFFGGGTLEKLRAVK